MVKKPEWGEFKSVRVRRIREERLRVEVSLAAKEAELLIGRADDFFNRALYGEGNDIRTADQLVMDLHNTVNVLESLSFRSQDRQDRRDLVYVARSLSMIGDQVSEYTD